jgi:hypothetical protein
MAPPRQRPANNLDDSRSEASSGTREHKAPGPKARKTAAGASAAAASSMSTKDMKVAAAVAAVATLSGAAPDAAGQADELPGVS